MKISKFRKLTIFCKTFRSGRAEILGRRFLKGLVVCLEIDQVYVLLYFAAIAIGKKLRIEFKVRVFRSAFEISDGRLTIHICYSLPLGGQYERFDVHI